MSATAMVAIFAFIILADVTQIVKFYLCRIAQGNHCKSSHYYEPFCLQLCSKRCQCKQAFRDKFHKFLFTFVKSVFAKMPLTGTMAVLSLTPWAKRQLIDPRHWHLSGGNCIKLCYVKLSFKNQ
jgi:hypothetical protein